MELVDLCPTLPSELLQPVPSLGTSVPRNKVWLHASGAALKLQQNPHYYFRLAASIPQIPCKFDSIIEGDLKRTFPKERFYQSRDALANLERVLKAYARRNGKVGYVQGFNFIVGRMLSLGFDEEQTFWLFAQVMEVYLPLDYFYAMAGILIDQKVFTRLMDFKLPKLNARLSKLGIDCSLFCVQWFLSLFAGVFSQHAITQVWDLFFLKGTIVLPQVALALLFSERWAIKSCDNFNKMVQMLERAPAVVYDPSDLLDTAQTRFRIEPELYDSLVAAVRKEVYEGISVRMNQTISPDSQSFLTFAAGSVELVEDYLSSEEVSVTSSAEECERNSDALMIGVVGEDDHKY